MTPFTLIFALVAFLNPLSAHAIKTASSFDASWAYVPGLGITATEVATGFVNNERTLSSKSGFQIDYNVALFDYRTVVSFSFLELLTSNLGEIPISRLSIGASYHFLRVNGQRVLLDNQVESRVWGISPAIELSLGITKVTIKDPNVANFNFAASLLDVMPRLLIEVPITSSFLLMLRAGPYLTLKGANTVYDIKMKGLIINVGFKLTTL